MTTADAKSTNNSSAKSTAVEMMISNGDSLVVDRVEILGRESIFVGSNLFKSDAPCLGAQLIIDFIHGRQKKHSATIVVISDSTLNSLGHVDLVKSALSLQLSRSGGHQSRVIHFIVGSGEGFKTRKTKEDIENFMLENKCTRDSCIVALGGGVVGDMAGFVGATFMRGVDVIQVPTSLMAMVDSSIGGKTAVDTPHGKNLIGAFWQPSLIIIDTFFLSTLPLRQLSNGLAEVIKTGAFWDSSLFRYLEDCADVIMAGPPSAVPGADGGGEWFSIMRHLIKEAAKVKAYVVTHDERESGLRGLLNFGHTVGHAIEAVFAPDLLHGEAVAIGMVKEAEISRHLGHLDQVNLARLVRCLKAYRLPAALNDKLIYRLERETGKRWSVDQLLDIMRVDKKNVGPIKKVVLISGIGETVELKASAVEDQVISLVCAESVTVEPPSSLKFGSRNEPKIVQVPGSKSISNRVLLIAALGSGPCEIHGLLHSDDTQVMLQALQQLGSIKFEWKNNGKVLSLDGTGGELSATRDPVYLGNAGTASRFLTTVCTLASPTSGLTSTVITGNERMKQRPIGPLVDSLRKNDCSVEYLENEGCLPLRIKALGGLKGGRIHLSASVSSQYVSSVLISAPYAKEPVTLVLGGTSASDSHVVSQPYIDMTIAIMKAFGINVHRDVDQPNTYSIPLGNYQNPSKFFVEPDASSATYPLAVAAILGHAVKIENMGTKSLQGDARFAVDVLKVMGCTVEQDETSTTVLGPTFGSLRPIAHIDMEPMTDAFLTASVLAAVATGTNGNTTQITGISNQRVKECNRIEAMVTQLQKIGVSAWELDDGIAIEGMSLTESEFKAPVEGIHCYDDHRVAMSFSVLACALPLESGLVIQEKHCVEKTWPSWWDTLSNVLHVPVNSSSYRLLDASDGNVLDSFGDSSVVLIGMRGVGKTTLGRSLAERMSYRFIDLDEEIAVYCGKSCKEVIEHDGWDKFRDCESAVLRNVIESNPLKTVVSCGGGIVERESNCDVLCRAAATNLVVHIERDIGSVVAELMRDEGRPSLGDDLFAVYSRRLPKYRRCRNSVFTVCKYESRFNWELTERKFAEVVSRLVGVNSSPAAFVADNDAAMYSHFLSLTFPNYESELQTIAECSHGVNAVEARIDLLESFDIEFVRRQVGALISVVDIPIVYTVRTQSQCGKFSDGKEEELMDLLKLGIEMGCEYIDVQTSMQMSPIQEIKRYARNSRIIASYHNTELKNPWASVSVLEDEISKAASFGDIVKVVMTATENRDNIDLESVRSDPESVLGSITKPVLAINMQPVGQASRVYNKYLTPVTHEALPARAAPGQLTLPQLMKARSLLGLIEPRYFCLIGSPIQHSKSPQIHNGWFSDFGLDDVYTYHLLESETVSEVVLSALRDPSLGGMSVTIPLKQAVIPHLDDLSEAASDIGAVNTVVRARKNDGTRILFGDNTDWKGIFVTMTAKIKAQPKIVLVVGAGGTARAAIFAAKRIVPQPRVFVCNRTEEKGKSLAERFGVNFVAMDQLATIERADVIISTIPGYSQDEVTGQLETLLSSSRGATTGILVEMAYKPAETPLMKLASQSGCWSIISGPEVLVAQAREQFKSWTNIMPPP